MKQVAKVILAFEPLVLVIITGAFWFDDPARSNYLPLLVLPLLARLILYRRVWVSTPANLFFYVFLVLCAVNTYLALSHPSSPPYSWGWYQVGRPLMGIVLALSIISSVYERGSANALVLALLAFALFVGILGLGSAQFTSKSDALDDLTRLLPKLRGLPGAEGGFNVNEIGGAMAFFAPFAAGFAIYEWRLRHSPVRIGLATLGFVLLMLALFLGQSRLAIIGVVVTLGILIFLLISSGRWRKIAFAALLIYCGLEILVVVGVGGFKEGSTTSRVEIWSAAVTLIRENPLTGYGLNQFRRRDVRDRLVPDYPQRFVPHAHNEILQVGADLGLPGLIVYVGWHVVLALMLWRAWRQGTPFVKTLAASAGAGLLAHAIFGLGDAITLFDRFSFAYWLLAGAAGSAFILLPARLPETQEPPLP